MDTPSRFTVAAPNTCDAHHKGNAETPIRLARELGPRGVTVNNVQPGPIATDMNPDEGDFADQLRPMLATGGYGQPGDAANAVAFLARRDTGYITGSTLNVDSGFTL